MSRIDRGNEQSKNEILSVLVFHFALRSFGNVNFPSQQPSHSAMLERGDEVTFYLLSKGNPSIYFHREKDLQKTLEEL